MKRYSVMLFKKGAGKAFCEEGLLNGQQINKTLKELGAAFVGGVKFSVDPITETPSEVTE